MVHSGHGPPGSGRSCAWRARTLNAVPGDRERVADRGAPPRPRNARGSGRRAAQDRPRPRAARHGIVPTPPSAEPRVHDRAVVDQQRRRGRGQRELVGGAVADLQVAGPRAGRQQRDLDRGDQLAVLEDVLDVRPLARRARRTRSAGRCASPSAPWMCTVASSATSGDAQIGGVQGDAVLARRPGSRASGPHRRRRRSPIPGRACCRPRTVGSRK